MWHIVPYIGKRQLQELRTEHVQSVINALVAEKKASATIRKAYAIMHMACEQAVTNGLLARNPAVKIVLPKKSQKEIHFFTVDEQQRFINGLPDDTSGRALYFILGTGKLRELRAGIKEETAALNAADAKRRQLDNKITASSTSKDVKKAGRQLELCQQLEQIFAKAIDSYSLKLKQSVEADASELFTRMSSDKDYTRLEINDNYGLNIIHKSGVAVPERSAGFEHVVALALIGALHMNAPLQGPVIMDSPFGRLDPIHKKNITENLPRLSTQVILLAYTDEIDSNMARECLGGYLAKECRLEKVSSFHTQIE